MGKLQSIIHFMQHATDEDVVEQLFENEMLIWIDWREYEEDVISYFNHHLPVGEQIKCEVINIDKPRGVDIVLSTDQHKLTIPFADERTDRDTSIRAMQEMVAPRYQIRWYMGSLGSDTLAFVLLPAEQWTELEERFGKEKVEFHFQPVTSESVMFDLDADEVFRTIRLREKAMDLNS